MQVFRRPNHEVRAVLPALVSACFEGTSQYRSNEEVERLMSLLFSEAGMEFYLGELNGEVVGFACGFHFTVEHLTPPAYFSVFRTEGKAEPGDYYFALIGLKPEHRSLSRARALYRAQVESSTAAVIWARTLVQNDPVRTLLAREGYCEAVRQGDGVILRLDRKIE